MKVLFALSNGSGYGHVVRMLAVAKQLKRFKQNQLLFFTPSSASWMLERKGISFIRTPIFISKGEKWLENFIANVVYKNTPRTIDLKKTSYALQMSLFRAALSSFKPDVVVVDLSPEYAIEASRMGYRTMIIYESFDFGKKIPEQNRKAYKYSDDIIVPSPKSMFVEQLKQIEKIKGKKPVFVDFISNFEGSGVGKKRDIRKKLNLIGKVVLLNISKTGHNRVFK